jgi:transcriptional regulator with PAS, ATPase and Fis domain
VSRIGGYAWPGNVRELENTVERMLVAAGPARILTRAHLPPGFASTRLATPGDRAGPRASVLPGIVDVQTALARHDGARARAAADLGISRHQLYRILTRGAVCSGEPVRERRASAWCGGGAWRPPAARSER